MRDRVLSLRRSSLTTRVEVVTTRADSHLCTTTVEVTQRVSRPRRSLGTSPPDLSKHPLESRVPGTRDGHRPRIGVEVLSPRTTPPSPSTRRTDLSVEVGTVVVYVRSTSTPTSDLRHTEGQRFSFHTQGGVRVETVPGSWCRLFFTVP